MLCSPNNQQNVHKNLLNHSWISVLLHLSSIHQMEEGEVYIIFLHPSVCSKYSCFYQNKAPDPQTHTKPSCEHVAQRVSGFYQVVDDVEAVVLAVVGVDAAVSLLPHVILQRGFISEGFLTVQTLQTDQRTYNHGKSYTKSHIHVLCAELVCVCAPSCGLIWIYDLIKH